MLSSMETCTSLVLYCPKVPETKSIDKSKYPIIIREIGYEDSILLGISPTVDRLRGRIGIVEYEGDIIHWYEQ